jgi:hypothetical protein
LREKECPPAILELFDTFLGSTGFVHFVVFEGANAFVQAVFDSFGYEFEQVSISVYANCATTNVDVRDKFAKVGSGGFFVVAHVVVVRADDIDARNFWGFPIGFEVVFDEGDGTESERVIPFVLVVFGRGDWTWGFVILVIPRCGGLWDVFDGRSGFVVWDESVLDEVVFQFSGRLRAADDVDILDRVAGKNVSDSAAEDDSVCSFWEEEVKVVLA